MVFSEFSNVERSNVPTFKRVNGRQTVGYDDENGGREKVSRGAMAGSRGIRRSSTPPRGDGRRHRDSPQ
jgi:hypothetical protein